jgi:phospholipid/cholesterol/gamma-HCH transport system permease protein
MIVYGVEHIFVKIGRATVSFLRTYGRFTRMVILSIIALHKAPIYISQVVEQYIYIGKRSLPLITISAIFMGLLMGVQLGTQMSATTPAWVEGGLILRTVLLEMGPIIMGIVLAGRVGSGIASEIGTMKVTEQVDALRTMGIDPVEYLVMPRLLSGTVAFTMLIVFFDLLAVLASFVSTYFTIDMTWVGFVRGMRMEFVLTDVYTTLIKAFLFGFVVISSGTFFGLETSHGAKGVGATTTSAVIWSSIGIIVLDYVISALLYMMW